MLRVPRTENEMAHRLNGLWIGLKLLGVYFLVTGLAEVGSAIQLRVSVQNVSASGGDMMAQVAYRNIIHALVTIVGGILLLLTADYFAPFWRERNPGGGESGEPGRQ
jgi:hypothetical protein